MKKIIPEIHVKNCKEVLEYYKEIFGGEIKNVQQADGIEMFKGYEGKIIHAELHINNECVIYFVDLFEDSDLGSNARQVLEMDSKEEINRVYSAFSEDGNVIYPLQKTFLGAFHGVVIDRYGNTWALNCTIG